MRWRGRPTSNRVEDRRGQGGFGGGFGGGGGGGIPVPKSGCGCCGALVLMGIMALLFGGGGLPGGLGSPGGGMGDLLPPEVQSVPSGGGAYEPGPQSPNNRSSNPQDQSYGAEPSDDIKEFVSVILADTEQTFDGLLRQMGREYQGANLVLFSGSTRSACGGASGSVGPFYCQLDEKVYLDFDFFEELSKRFGAGGDFAAAYVIAHEIGHHVQNELGILSTVNDMRRRASKRQANDLSIRLELQADCLAGVWSHYANQKGMLEEGDIEEGLQAAAAVGDDNIQRRTQGWVVPESFTHGTSEQRQKWFYQGLRSGDPESCETFE